MRKTVECDSGLCFSMAKVVHGPVGASYTFGAEVELPGGESVRYALALETARLHGVAPGEHALVMYHPQGQHADIVSVRQVAEAMGHTLKG